MTLDSITEAEARAIGRRAAESSYRSADKPVFSRDLMFVMDVDGASLTVGVDGLGTMTGVPMTTACAGVQVGDIVIVDTYMHKPIAIGVIER